MFLRKAEIFAELQRYMEQIQSLYNFSMRFQNESRNYCKEQQI